MASLVRLSFLPAVSVGVSALSPWFAEARHPQYTSGRATDASADASPASQEAMDRSPTWSRVRSTARFPMHLATMRPRTRATTRPPGPISEFPITMPVLFHPSGITPGPDGKPLVRRGGREGGSVGSTTAERHHRLPDSVPESGARRALVHRTGARREPLVHRARRQPGRRQRHRPIHECRRLQLLPDADGRLHSHRCRGRPRRQRVVHRGERRPDRRDHARGSHHGVRGSRGLPGRHHAWFRQEPGFTETDKNNVAMVSPAGRLHRVPDSDGRLLPQRDCLRPRREPLVYRVERKQDRQATPAGVFAEFVVPTPLVNGKGPKEITAGPDGTCSRRPPRTRSAR